MGRLVVSNHSEQMRTGVVTAHDPEKLNYRVALDQGLSVNARLLDTGNVRALIESEKVLCVRAETTQWLIIGVIPLVSRNTTSDSELNQQLSRFPTSPTSNTDTPSYRQPGDIESLGPGDYQTTARSDISFARLVLWAAGGALIEAGRRAFLYFNGVAGIIKQFCFTYVLSIPRATAALIAKADSRKTQASLDMQPTLLQGLEEADRLTILAGADAVDSSGEQPIERKQGSCGEVTSATAGKPGISLVLGQFIKTLMDSQAGKMKITLGGNNTFEFDLQQLRAALSDTELIMGANGIVLKKGAETINLGLQELIFTVTALTMTVANAVNLTAANVNIKGVTSINGYKFVEDLITTLNQQWLLQYNLHVHTSDVPGAPTSPPTTPPLLPITPTG